eukprot:TRINITY_DN13059_c0_g1_i2.p1 TRINITY_DN13059_c0_g1~~TRINITY_DN13059_c0_g1_i2.p1  ORF type:complete len:456 (+),score=57.89 TRINITY_DN13059_c0_g1_i2:706-2073(+)
MSVSHYAAANSHRAHFLPSRSASSQNATHGPFSNSFYRVPVSSPCTLNFASKALTAVATASKFPLSTQRRIILPCFPNGALPSRSFEREKRRCTSPCIYATMGEGSSEGNAEGDLVQPTVPARVKHDEASFLNALISGLRRANAFLPQVIAGSTLLALVYPPSFSWFTAKYYAPALGFLMFAVGINLSLEDFQRAFHRPGPIALGYAAQFGLKPLLGVLLATTVVPLLGLGDAIASGLILTSCVSGAQLSNYATFLVEPTCAPLSIVLTALSTATAVFVTPALTLLLLGRRLPVNATAMVSNIAQIVVIPIAAGLFLNRFATPVSKAIKPSLPALSVFTTALCVGSPLAVNSVAVRSQSGLLVLIPVVLFHALGFLAGYGLAQVVYKKDGVPLARTLSLETGMQSSLLGLALATKFFPDPLVGIPSAISVIVMSLMGFALVMLWAPRDSPSSSQS